MNKSAKSAISPTRKENYPEWYQQVITAADLAENSAVRGCMVIKPWGYSLWENIQKDLDKRFKETGHENAYFPLFIPLSFLEKEAEHVEGFAKECAVVTHHRLEESEDGGLKPAGALEEPLIVRPTSETIIGDAFSRWINSYRDLPILINQWANVVRWEMRTRLFLRTSEFLWQEGHTAHATAEEAQEEARQMHQIYCQFAEDFLAIPVIGGEKTESERFPGALDTYTIEMMMQDGKALQGGTSHFLGQNFSKAQNIKFQNIDNEEEHAWTTSWGVSTRLVGALIMAHSDDDGLKLPPKVSPLHTVILPITPKDGDKDLVIPYVKELSEKLKSLTYNGEALRNKIDMRDLRGGEKNWSWIKKGVPIRLEVGPRDVKEGKVCVTRRDRPHKDKKFVSIDDLLKNIPMWLEEIQNNLFTEALNFRKTHSHTLDNFDDFKKLFNKKNSDDIQGGFVHSHWCGSSSCESQISNELKVTIRCIPLDGEKENGSCIKCGEPSERRVVFSKAY